jgi:hypothetical protein
MCAYYPDEVQQFYLTAPITTPVGVLVVKLIGIHVCGGILCGQ